MIEADPQDYFAGARAELERDRTWRPPAGRDAHRVMRAVCADRVQLGVASDAMRVRLDRMPGRPRAPRLGHKGGGRPRGEKHFRPIFDRKTEQTYANAEAASAATRKPAYLILVSAERSGRFEFADRAPTSLEHAATA